MALYGVTGIWGYHTLLVLALAHAPRLEANIVNYTWTLWIVVLGGLLPGHRLTGRILAAGLLGFLGVVLTIGGDSWSRGGAALSLAAQSLDAHGLGFGLALAASLVWAGFTVFMRKVVPRERNQMAWFCLLSAGAALIFALLRGASLALPLSQAPVVVFLGLVPLGLSFLLWEYAAQRAQIQVLGLMSFFTPLLSTLLLSLVSGQAITPWLFGGMALILTGAGLGGSLPGRGLLGRGLLGGGLPGKKK